MVDSGGMDRREGNFWGGFVLLRNGFRLFNLGEFCLPSLGLFLSREASKNRRYHIYPLARPVHQILII